MLSEAESGRAGRKIIVLSMISLDGVMQAPGGPKEDSSGGFKFGGWVAPFGDEAYGKVVKRRWNLQIISWAERHLRFGNTTGLHMPMFGRVSMMARNTSCPKP